MDRGRPRNFDREQALDAALAVFWRDGYLGASLSTLTEAMGINKPSLYAAFGNKAELYKKALDQYCRQRLFRHAAALAEPDIKSGLQHFLQSVADMLTAKDLPGGCLVVNSAVSCSSGVLPEDVAEALSRTMSVDLAGILKKRLLDEHRLRGWPDEDAIDSVVDYIIAVMSGMAVMSRLGVDRARLDKLIIRSLSNLT